MGKQSGKGQARVPINLHVSLAVVQLVFEDLAVHDVLVLVNQSSHARVRCRALILILNDVEGIGAVGVDARGQHKFVELVEDHWVDIRVDVELDREPVD